ncbi:MAG TPA: acyl-CoA synthetase FdrA [Methylomirabilota bacterium]|nr:acyl-CoA synthetase FdrA [Methylomirabilota bacterium]
MPTRALVRRSFYQDSMVLMQAAAELRALPGVREAAALMGTPANHEVLAAAGLATPETKTATASDLLLAVDADTEAAAEAALAAGARRLDERTQAREATGRVLPRTLDGALRQIPDANLALISVPGAYAKLEAMSALRRGLHVFLFSDNVPIADEVELKRFAARQRLLCMGPDCGTAYVGGVGLGFANVVPRGRVGCVAASGTGLQAVASRLAALGEGISHGIGVGGRDLSAEVGGAMTTLALEALGADAATEAVVVVSKPPAPGVLAALEAAIAAVRKPVVVCCLGATPRAGAPGTWVTTLDDAAGAAAAAVRGESWAPRLFGDPAAVRARLAGLQARGSVLGLYTGGTLAHEAHLVLAPLLGAIPHRIVDLGDDEYTRGRLHPMIDPSLRESMVREAGDARDVGVLLLDLVLGRAAHTDPAPSLAAAIRAARARATKAGRALLVVASVVGTAQDPQPLAAQVAALEGAGTVVLPSNAEAARFAALALVPDLAARLLGGAR